MGASNPSNRTYEIYKLKVVKETNTPYFFKKEKKGDEWVEAEQYTEISGYLKKVETGSYLYEGVEKKTFKMTLDDDTSDAVITVEGHLNNISRSMFNTLAGATNIKLIKLTARLWGKKGADKKYPTVFVEVNSQKADWRYRMDDLPQVEEIKNSQGKVLTKDDSAVNDFFISTVIPEINSKIVSEFTVVSEMESGSGRDLPKSTANTGSHEEIESDLPF